MASKLSHGPELVWQKVAIVVTEGPDKTLALKRISYVVSSNSVILMVVISKIFHMENAHFLIKL